MKLALFLLTDLLLGYVPQAAGCAVCLFMFVKESLRTRKFLITTCFYSMVAVVIRLAYTWKLIDFGFHTVVIWAIFVLIAIAYNRYPVVQSTFSILVSGVLITVSELITAGILVLIYGEKNFTNMMNNTETLDGKLVKALCGVPTNILFLIIVLVAYFVARRRWKKNSEATQNVTQ